MSFGLETSSTHSSNPEHEYTCGFSFKFLYRYRTDRAGRLMDKQYDCEGVAGMIVVGYCRRPRRNPTERWAAENGGNGRIGGHLHLQQDASYARCTAFDATVRYYK